MGAASETGEEAGSLQRAIDLIRLLAVEVGPRPSTGAAERRAAELLRERLDPAMSPRLQGFDGYRSFAYPFSLILLAAIAPSLLPARMRRARSLLALAAATTLAAEGDLRFTPLSGLLSRRRSQNLVATVEPSGEAKRTLCLLAHLDSSRSGLLFHPRAVAHLGRWIATQSVAVLLGALLEAVIGGTDRGRRLLAALRLLPAAGLISLWERELLGVDVAGANDNASGAAVASVLAAEVGARPLRHTRLVLLLSGCEEVGTLGAQAFLRSHDTDGWLFLNFDNVGGDGSVRYLRREGVLAKWSADPGLIAVAERVGSERPELRVTAEDSPAGLTYDSSPILARGGRALTLSVQDGYIPNLHWPTDTFGNVDRDGVSRTLRCGRAMIAEIDRGGAEL